jgi:DNA-binding LacI/PurR family transcriptional regulator
MGADPPLTSIDMCLEGVGRKAAELLLAAIDGEPAHGLTTAPCTAHHPGIIEATRRAGQVTCRAG